MPRKRLTYKQKAFVSEFVKTRNATEAAMKAYKPKNRNVARNMGSITLANPNVKKSIDTYLKEAHYDPASSIAQLIEVQDTPVRKITGADKINAAKTLLQLSGMLVERRANLNMNIDTAERSTLITENERLRKQIERIKSK